ncbi:hypothetical protein [Streptomyces sp. NPDC017988]|uniref:hypothetical protein n=1 Tax=Streptomyces sp. NPDC017988 TaxID=3365025 RepID=UPI003790A253
MEVEHRFDPAQRVEYRLDEGGHVACPLGAGAMAVREPPGDRARMARHADRTREACETEAAPSPAEPDAALLQRIAEEAGHPVPAAGVLPRAAFDVPAALRARRSTGSTNPDEARRACAAGSADLDRSEELRAARETRMGRGAAEPDQALADITWARTPC